jgi:hypothetical protein
MLDAGFILLTALKAQVLPAAMQDDTDYDEQIAAIGKAVAGRMNRHTSRSLERAAAVTEEFDALAFAWVLSRYPVETVSGIVVKDTDGSVSALTAGDWRLSKKSGLIEINGSAGTRLESVVVTYTGGYWLDDGETMPSGATPMPDDLLQAFVMQVQAVCEHREIFRTIALRKEDRTASEAKLTDLRLIPEVVETLLPFRRFAGS